ncbi:MAG: hypothetical protein AAF468_09035 [Pseudomonadota bacterium]
MSFDVIDPETLKQLETLPAFDRPLLICDVDEVMLHLVDPFAKIMEERGFELKFHGFKLNGNVFHKETGREAERSEVRDALFALFTEQEERQAFVAGAVDAINGLSDEIDILFLTNMPHEYGDVRRRHFASNGLEFPLVTNSGTKGPVVLEIRGSASPKTGFIDDTPYNLKSVREHVPHAELYHFMATEAFRTQVETPEGTRISSGDWAETVHVIKETLLN